jgi:hypothetical protein
MFAGQCHGQTPRCAGRRQRRCPGRRSRLFSALRVRGRQTIGTRAAAEQHRPILSRTEPTASYGEASTPRKCTRPTQPSSAATDGESEAPAGEEPAAAATNDALVAKAASAASAVDSADRCDELLLDYLMDP